MRRAVPRDEPFYMACRKALSVGAEVLTQARFLNVPDLRKRAGGLLMASNHQSYLDPVLIGVGVKSPIAYMARRTLWRLGPFGRLLTAINVHPVSRGSMGTSELKTVLRLLRGGWPLVVFPEGTRSRDGSVGPFKAGAAAIAIRSGVPVMPVCVEGAFECWPRARLLPRPAHVAVAYGEPIVPQDETAEELSEKVRAEVLVLRGQLQEYLASRA